MFCLLTSSVENPVRLRRLLISRKKKPGVRETGETGIFTGLQFSSAPTNLSGYDACQMHSCLRVPELGSSSFLFIRSHKLHALSVLKVLKYYEVRNYGLNNSARPKSADCFVSSSMLSYSISQ